MSRKFKFYSEGEKLSLLHSYYASGMSKKSFCKAHGLCGPTLLDKWIAKYTPLAEKDLPLPSEESFEEMANRSKEEYKEEVAQLKKRVKDLEKALSFSKLETEVRDMLIARAEEYFDIPIRKKPGVK
jgi:transposase-like protein